MPSANTASDFASHLSARQEGETYAETVRFNNNDFQITMEDPELCILTDTLLESLSMYVMRLNEAVAYEFTAFTGLKADSTLVDITALRLDDPKEYLQSYQSAVRLSPADGVVCLCVPYPLQLALMRKFAGVKAPFYERTIESEGIIPGFDYPSAPTSFLDNALLTPYYAAMLQMAALAVDDALPNGPVSLSLAQASKHLESAREDVHYKIRYSLMFDEAYRFKDGREIISRGAYIEFFFDGRLIEQMLQAKVDNRELETANKGIDIQKMVRSYPKKTLRQEVEQSCAYTLLLLFLLFDDETTTAIASRLLLDKQLKFVLRLLSKNCDDETFVTLEPSWFNLDAAGMLEEAIRCFGIEPKRREVIPYDQSVRVANIALKIQQ